jgi:hypothetical protein
MGPFRHHHSASKNARIVCMARRAAVGKSGCYSISIVMKRS